MFSSKFPKLLLTCSLVLGLSGCSGVEFKPIDLQGHFVDKKLGYCFKVSPDWTLRSDYDHYSAVAVSVPEAKGDKFRENLLVVAVEKDQVKDPGEALKGLSNVTKILAQEESKEGYLVYDLLLKGGQTSLNAWIPHGEKWLLLSFHCDDEEAMKRWKPVFLSILETVNLDMELCAKEHPASAQAGAGEKETGAETEEPEVDPSVTPLEGQGPEGSQKPDPEPEKA